MIVRRRGGTSICSVLKGGVGAVDGMKSGVRREERAEGKSSPWERRAGDAAADRASSESPDRRWSKFLLQQLQLSADALALSFLSSFMGSGNSLYSSTSVSCSAIKKQGKRERERTRRSATFL